MTKELKELISNAGCMISQLGRYNGNDNESQARTALREIESYLNEFFNSNICIHKGVNRHPYADVLHALAEGVLCEYKLGKSFVDLDNLGVIRIKPSDPIYEWQWMYKFKNGNEFLFTTYQTEEENTHFMSTIDCTALGESSRKIEETKRIRE